MNTVGARTFRNGLVDGWRKQRLIRRAKHYVTGGLAELWGLSGRIQLDLLKRSGCTPQSKVLEIGCGCLNAGVPIMEFLEPGNYVGLEPNRWLIDAILWDERVAELVKSREPQFLFNESFDARAANLKFDYVISHSVLSHASRVQLELFIRNVREVVKPGARILASIRMTDRKGNLVKDSNDTEWRYPVGRKERMVRRLLGLKLSPSVTHFSFDTVRSIATANGLTVVWEKEFREIFTKHSPAEYHDWLIFCPTEGAGVGALPTGGGAAG